ncbi:MAG: DUF3098 domain-containing protein [Flavisolibacter sp.]|nr:DUF3098 domain-containing protein [Flavisolibacter sp.]
MKSKRTTTLEKPVTTGKPATAEKIPPVQRSVSYFDRQNLWWMVAGAVLMIIGFLLMSGGRSDDPNVFNDKEVYSPVRITIAPILILAGLAVEIYAIFRTPKEQ